MMRTVTIIVGLFFLFPGFAKADQSYYGNNLITAVKRLDRSAQYLYKSTHREFGYSRLTDDARSFSRAASRLCQLAMYGASERELAKSYQRLIRRFDRIDYKVARHYHRSYVGHSLAKAGRALNRVGNVLSKQRYADRRAYPHSGYDQTRYSARRWQRRSAYSRGY